MKLSHALGRAALTTVVAFTVCAGIVANGHIVDAKQETMTSQASGEAAMAIRPHAPGSPAALTEAHNCWTDEAPAAMRGVIPTHAVITLEGESAPVYTGDAQIVGRALEAMGTDEGIRVHSFCE